MRCSIWDFLLAHKAYRAEWKAEQKVYQFITRQAYSSQWLLACSGVPILEPLLASNPFLGTTSLLAGYLVCLCPELLPVKNSVLLNPDQLTAFPWLWDFWTMPWWHLCFVLWLLQFLWSKFQALKLLKTAYNCLNTVPSIACNFTKPVVRYRTPKQNLEKSDLLLILKLETSKSGWYECFGGTTLYSLVFSSGAEHLYTLYVWTLENFPEIKVECSSTMQTI